MVFSADSNETLTIAETVEMLQREGFDVSTHKLRQYEKQGLLSPAKSVGQHRIYKDSDLRRVRMVLALIALGFSIKEIKTFREVQQQAESIIDRAADWDDKFKTNLYLVNNEGRNTDEHGEQQHEDILKRWTSIEINKNLLILSRYVDFYRRIIEAIDRKKQMLELTEKVYFERTYTDPVENLLKRLQEQVAKKPPQ